MRVLVCGGRDFTDEKLLHETLMNHCDSDTVIISGAARGADTLAIKWAKRLDLSFEEYPADWKLYGKSAGYIRNQQMLDEGRPDRVVAFPGGKGTAMMMKIADKAGVPVYEIPK